MEQEKLSSGMTTAANFQQLIVEQNSLNDEKARIKKSNLYHLN